MKHWYVVHTKPRQESVACENLVRQKFEVWLPRIRQIRRRQGRSVHRVEPLFPRYLFIRLDLGSDNVSPIRSTLGVSALVRFGGSPVHVPDDLVSALRECVDSESGLYRPADDSYVEGTRVTVLEGPFSGLNAIFQTDCGDERSIILLDILGSVQSVRIEKEHLIPTSCT